MYCSNCGINLKQNWGYCSDCGAQVPRLEYAGTPDVALRNSVIIPNRIGFSGVSAESNVGYHSNQVNQKNVDAVKRSKLRWNRTLDKWASLIGYISVNSIIIFLMSIPLRPIDVSRTNSILYAILVITLFLFLVLIMGNRLASLYISRKYSMLLCLIIVLFGITGVILVGLFCYNNIIREGIIQTKIKLNRNDQEIINEAKKHEPVFIDVQALEYLDFLVSRVFLSCSDMNDLIRLVSDNDNNADLKDEIRAANIQDLYVLFKGFDYCYATCAKQNREIFQILRQLTLSELRKRNHTQK